LPRNPRYQEGRPPTTRRKPFCLDRSTIRMLTKWGGALWRSLHQWRYSIGPLLAFVLAWYPEVREVLGTAFRLDLPEVSRWVLVSVPLAGVVIIALCRRVIALEEKLAPKLELRFDRNTQGCVHETHFSGGTTAPYQVLFVRVLPVCNSRVTNCVGFLSGVYRLDNGEWQPTALDERLDLTWANRGNAEPITIQSGLPQYLDVFCIPSSNRIALCVASNVIPNRAASVLDAPGIFRMDVGVMGDDNAVASISLLVQLGATWNAPRIELINP